MELRQAFEAHPDVRIVWVMPDNQINDKSLRFIDDLGLRERITFGVDPRSASIDRLKIRLANPEPVEEGVPHPTTYLLDREGVVRFVDVREDYHRWLDPALVVSALANL